MDNHYCICIGRKFGSGGRNVAKLVADKLGVKVYDKDLLKTASDNTGFSEEFFKEADEENTRKGLRGLLMAFHNGGGLADNYLSNESIFQMQGDAIRTIHEREDCVFIGRCADYVLRDSDRLLNVFIAARMSDRVDRICRHADEMTPQKAQSLIDDIDRKRSSYYNYYTGRTWGDPAVYDLCLNSSVLSYEECASIILEVAKKKLGL